MVPMCPKCGSVLQPTRGRPGLVCVKCGLSSLRQASLLTKTEQTAPSESVVMSGKGSGSWRALRFFLVAFFVIVLILSSKTSNRNLAERFYNWVTSAEQSATPAPVTQTDMAAAHTPKDAYSQTVVNDPLPSAAVSSKQTMGGERVQSMPLPVEPPSLVVHRPKLTQAQQAQVELARGAEVIVVSGYEGSGGGPKGAPVQVTINRPGSAVLLVLTSYKQIAWTVNAVRGTHIKAIVWSGYNDSSIRVASDIPIYKGSLPFSSDQASLNFTQLEQQLQQQYGVQQVDAFRGQYTLLNKIVVDSLDAQQKPHVSAYAEQIPPRPADSHHAYRPAQPSASQAAQHLSRATSVRATSDQYIYRIVGHRFEAQHPVTGERTELVMPVHYPELSWPVAVAYDSRRQLVILGSLGGEGFLYRFNTQTGQWLDYHSLENFDISALAYDESSDRYVAQVGKAQLILSGDGQLLSRPTSFR